MARDDTAKTFRARWASGTNTTMTPAEIRTRTAEMWSDEVGSGPTAAVLLSGELWLPEGLRNKAGVPPFAELIVVDRTGARPEPQSIPLVFPARVRPRIEKFFERKHPEEPVRLHGKHLEAAVSVVANRRGLAAEVREIGTTGVAGAYTRHLRAEKRKIADLAANRCDRVAWRDAITMKINAGQAVSIALVGPGNASATAEDIAERLKRIRKVEVTLEWFTVRQNGADSVPETCRAVADASRRNDLVLLYRGGGGEIDFWPYNSSAVAEAIVRSDVPVLAALGHRADRPLIEKVIDDAFAVPDAMARAVWGAVTGTSDYAGSKRAVEELERKLAAERSESSRKEAELREARARLVEADRREAQLSAELRSQKEQASRTAVQLISYSDLGLHRHLRTGLIIVSWLMGAGALLAVVLGQGPLLLVWVMIAVALGVPAHRERRRIDAVRERIRDGLARSHLAQPEIRWTSVNEIVSKAELGETP